MLINQQILFLQMMSQAQGQHRDLIQSIEGLPPSQGPSPLDQDLLLLKATSLATMTCLSDCLHILQLQQVARQKVSFCGECFFYLCVDPCDFFHYVDCNSRYVYISSFYVTFALLVCMPSVKWIIEKCKIYISFKCLKTCEMRFLMLGSFPFVWLY